jgi:hypothetical protein
VAVEHTQRLDQLQALVLSLREGFRSDTLQRIAEHLQWLERHEQAPEIVAAARRLAPAANVWLSVSQDFIVRTTSEPLDRTDPLTDTVLGTTVHGTSHLVGTMAAVPVPAKGEAILEARLAGDADTEGWGYNGPVRACVVGRASVQAAGEIRFGPAGFRVGAATAHVCATGRPTRMWTTCRSHLANGLITCIAWRRSRQTQQLGDRIASQHAEDRLEQQLSEELRGRVAKLQRGYDTRFRHPLLRYEAFPRHFQAGSQAGGAAVEMLVADAVQLGAWSEPPSSEHVAPLQAQIHETALNNLADTMLAGRQVSEQDLQQFTSSLLGAESRESPAVRDAVDIALAPQRPLTFRIQDAMLEIRIRATQFVRGRTRYPAMHMILKYRVERDGDQLVATQAGEPEIVPQDFEQQGSRTLSAREVAARRLIATMLERELAARYELSRIRLPEQSEVAEELIITHLVARDGWLDLGARRPDQAPAETGDQASSPAAGLTHVSTSPRPPSL